MTSACRFGAACSARGCPAPTEESPDLYLSMPRVLECVAANGGAAGAMELGFLAAQRASFGGLRHEFQCAMIAAPSGLARLQSFFRYGKREDTGVRTGFSLEGRSIRVFCESPGFERHPALVVTEWMNLLAIVSILRSLAGATWSPAEITLISRRAPHEAARATFPNTRILCGQGHTSVLVPREVLARPCREAITAQDLEPEMDATELLRATDPLYTIRELVKPYLRDKPLLIHDLAALLGTSERSLQRHLAAMGTSYSQLVAEARYQVACDLLERDDVRIMEIAFAAGYQNPSHFSRAFRRFAGISPIEYRLAAMVA